MVVMNVQTFNIFHPVEQRNLELKRCAGYRFVCSGSLYAGALYSSSITGKLSQHPFLLFIVTVVSLLFDPPGSFFTLKYHRDYPPDMRGLIELTPMRGEYRDTHRRARKLWWCGEA